MEHEVFVPVPSETVRQALRDPARVARCIPGFQQDADESAGPLSGRLKVRIGGHTITYRGALRIVEQDEVFAVESEGVEARGSGSAKVSLTIRPVESEGGTTLTFSATSQADGRAAELAPESTELAAHRLLDRFAGALVATVEEPEPQPEPAAAEPEPEGRAGSEGPGPVSVDDAERLGLVDAEEEPAGTEGPGSVSADADADAADGDDQEDEASGSGVFDAPVPPPPLGELAEEEFDALDAEDVEDVDELPAVPDEPPAEAAHARRTMIGRSAEEVDHAPPRGRYAPVPAAEAGSAGVTLRWIAPAAALAIASAVVVGRVLRRRK
ncbi:SRPBCC domain-containing protein [Streptomyces sp. NPDC020681]|uniref:SRPBCC domain-containing protein n=1 Tax=Streptomyces sp. NPDC020681 TaxID=3365083 RepID=UPI0037A0EB73